MTIIIDLIFFILFLTIAKSAVNNAAINKQAFQVAVAFNLFGELVKLHIVDAMEPLRELPCFGINKRHDKQELPDGVIAELLLEAGEN